MFFNDDLLSKPCSELISFFMNTHIWKLTFYFSFHCSNPFFCLRSVQITEQIVSICFNHRINCLHLFQSHNKLSPFFSSQNKLSPFVSITEQIVSICCNHRKNCLRLFQSQNKLCPSVPIEEQQPQNCPHTDSELHWRMRRRPVSPRSRRSSGSSARPSSPTRTDSATTWEEQKMLPQVPSGSVGDLK